MTTTSKCGDTRKTARACACKLSTLDGARVWPKYPLRVVFPLLAVCVGILQGTEFATAEDRFRRNAQVALRTPLSIIEATLLTTARADFEGDDDAYAAVLDWQVRRLHLHSIVRSTRGQDEEEDHAWAKAPYLACSTYRDGKRARAKMRDHVGAHHVYTVANSRIHGVCFVVSASLAEAREVVDDASLFCLKSFGPFPSTIKLSPGLLDHGKLPATKFSSTGLKMDEDGSSEKVHSQQEGLGQERRQQQQQQHSEQQRDKQVQRLSTSHGDAMRDRNVYGLNIEMTPGIFGEHSDSHLSDTDNVNHDAVHELVADLRDGLTSGSLLLHDISVWSDEEMLQGERGHIRHSSGSLRIREWTRAADVVHSQTMAREQGKKQEGSGARSPSEVCGWLDLRFAYGGDSLLLVTGLDHLLPWAEFVTKVRIREDESSAKDAKELQVACFMGLVAYFADRPEVLRVSPLHMPETFNAVSRAIIQSADVELTPLSDAGLDGTGQVVQVIDSGLDETSCFFIDEDGEEIAHGYYFDEIAFLASGETAIIFTGGDFTYDLSRRKVVQYVDFIKPDVDGSTQPYGSHFPTTSGDSAYWYDASGFDRDDFDGHGTHTAGTVAGFKLNTSAEVAACNGSQELGCVGGCINPTTIGSSDEFDIDGYCPRFNCAGGNESTGECLNDDTPTTLTQHGGVARGAKLAIFDVASEEAFLSDFAGNDLWRLSEVTGAKIHSNSWGSMTGCLMQPSGALYDDYMYKNPEHLLIFAAGNSGELSNDPSYNTCSIGSPAIAKNVLAVGATSSGPSRQPITNSEGSYDIRREPALDGADIDTVTWFSSRGPTVDGRIKPEVLAPGDQVFSAAGDGGDTHSCRLAAQIGTSMACPAVAGAAAMVRQYFANETFYVADLRVKGLCDKPDDFAFHCEAFNASAATVKAMLINSANLMGGSSEPDGERGFGRVHLEAGMPLAGDANKTLFVVDSSVTGLSEFNQDEYTFEISYSQGMDTTRTDIRATLAWLDPAASAFSAKQLQNDLDLSVISPSGDTYVMWATSGLRDGANVVERVIVPGAEASEGTWKLVVSAQGLITETQTYSLVVTGNISTGIVSSGSLTDETGGRPGGAPSGEPSGVTRRDLTSGYGLFVAVLCGVIISGFGTEVWRDYPF